MRLHVQGMDCADEASLVRHVLDIPGILSLNFDLVGRRNGEFLFCKEIRRAEMSLARGELDSSTCAALTSAYRQAYKLYGGPSSVIGRRSEA